MTQHIVCYSVYDQAIHLHSSHFHTLSMYVLFLGQVIAANMIISVVTLQIWFLFFCNPVVKAFAVSLLIAATIVTISLVAMQCNTYTILYPQLSSLSSLAWVH